MFALESAYWADSNAKFAECGESVTTAVQGATFVEHTEKLREMASTLKEVAERLPGTKIPDLLKLAGDEYGTTASQMKYALSFAGVKNLVKIDYDSATVSPVE